jgi:hypothetical protein
MADYLVRAKQVYNSSASSVSATFTESTPLNGNYLLVALMHLANATPPTAIPSTWTQLGPTYTGTGQALRAYACAGDGVTNSFSCTHASGGKSLVQLLAFRGFTSITPISEVGNKSSSVTSQTVTCTTSSGTYGVAIAVVGVNNTPTWGSWSGGTLNPSDTGGTSLADDGQLLNSARAEFTGSAITQTISWNPKLYTSYLSLVMPLVQEPTITTTSLNALKQWVAFSQTLACAGGVPSTWTVTAGALPAGLTLDVSTGQISGTPSSSGVYDFTVTAANTAGASAQEYTGTITPTVREYYIKSGQSVTPYLLTDEGLVKLN